MRQLVFICAVAVCAFAAPAPYDNPPKSGVWQEVSKYQVTDQNRETAPAPKLDHPSPVNPAVASEPAPKTPAKITPLSASEEEKLRKTREDASPKAATASDPKIKPIEGPTTVAPATVKASAPIHQVAKRSPDHTPDHHDDHKHDSNGRHEEHHEDHHGDQKSDKHDDHHHNRRSNDPKKDDHKPEHHDNHKPEHHDDPKNDRHDDHHHKKRETEPKKVEEAKPQVDVKPLDRKPIAAQKPYLEHTEVKRDTLSATSPQVNVKPPAASTQAPAKATEDKKKPDEFKRVSRSESIKEEAKPQVNVKPQVAQVNVKPPTTVPVQSAAHKTVSKRDTEAQKKPNVAPVPQVNVKPTFATKDIVKLPVEPTKQAVVKREDSKPVPQVNVKPTVNQAQPQVNVKPPTPVQSAVHKTKRDTEEQKRPAAVVPVTQVNVKPTVGAICKPKKEEKDEAPAPASKILAKREDVTTEAAPTSTTQFTITPTAIHSSFSHTWTRPQAPAAVAAAEDDKKKEEEPSRHVLAVIDPLKPFYDGAKTSTTTEGPSPSTTAAAQRVRRGVDQTEAQDEATTAKPTKAWWRRLDLTKEEEKPEAKKAVEEVKKPVVEEKPEAKKAVEEIKKPVVEENKKPAVVAVQEKEHQKRETKEAESKETTASPSVQKPQRPAEPTQIEYDNKPPQFRRPVPVAQILGSKQAELAEVHPSKHNTEESSEEHASSKQEENHRAADASVETKQQTKQN